MSLTALTPTQAHTRSRRSFFVQLFFSFILIDVWHRLYLLRQFHRQHRSEIEHTGNYMSRIFLIFEYQKFHFRLKSFRQRRHCHGSLCRFHLSTVSLSLFPSSKWKWKAVSYRSVLRFRNRSRQIVRCLDSLLLSGTFLVHSNEWKLNSKIDYSCAYLPSTLISYRFAFSHLTIWLQPSFAAHIYFCT